MMGDITNSFEGSSALTLRIGFTVKYEASNIQQLHLCNERYFNIFWDCEFKETVAAILRI